MRSLSLSGAVALHIKVDRVVVWLNAKNRFVQSDRLIGF
jgi:hypothetical protein